MAEELAKQRKMQLTQSRFKKEMAVDYETRFGIDSFGEAINFMETETNTFEAGDTCGRCLELQRGAELRPLG